MVLWVFLNYFQLLDVDADISVIYQGNHSTKVIDSLVREIFNNKRNWDQDEKTINLYEMLHQQKGGVKIFLDTVFICISEPTSLHRVSIFVMAMESKLHKSKETSQSVLECLRSKLGSGKTARKLLEPLKNPEKLKFRIVRCATDLSNKICPAINLNFVQPVFSIGRIFVFTWDSTKDILLWVFLYSCIDAIQSSEVINGEFVVSMIYFNGLTIFCAQVIMGIYISNRAHKIFKLPDYFVLRIAMKILFFVLTPFMPCFLILKKTKITMEKEKMLNKWRTSSMESPINVAKTVVLYEKKVENSVKIYAMLRLIEVFMESIIQLVLLLGYLTVTIMDHHALSISENMSFSSGAVF